MGACLSTPAAAQHDVPVPGSVVAPVDIKPVADAAAAGAPVAAGADQQQQSVAQFPVMSVQDAPVRPPWASRSPSDPMGDGSIPPPMGVGGRPPGRSTTAEAVRMNLSEVRREREGGEGGGVGRRRSAPRLPVSSGPPASSRPLPLGAGASTGYRPGMLGRARRVGIGDGAAVTAHAHRAAPPEHPRKNNSSPPPPTTTTKQPTPQHQPHRSKTSCSASRPSTPPRWSA
jgi:hypothetical protein